MRDERGRSKSSWRIGLWVAAALLLLVPLVAGFPWTTGDYVFAAVLLFGSMGTYELAARMTGNTAYRAGVGMALAATFLLVWINGAVGVTDSIADGWLLLVVPLAIVGALVARFRPGGMSRAMFAAAFAMLSIGLIALVGGIVPAYNSAFEILGLTGFFAMLFGGSALLFRQAAHGGAGQEAPGKSVPG